MLDTSIVLPDKKINFTEFVLNLQNPTWPKWSDCKLVANYVPGGQLYDAYVGNFIKTTYDPYYKIIQYYTNAARLEFSIKTTFSLDWNNSTHDYLIPGVGEDKGDLIDPNTGIVSDVKLYWNYSSLTNCVLDLLSDRLTDSSGNKLTDYEWQKRVNKLFHSDTSFLLAFDNSRKKLYCIRRPQARTEFNELSKDWLMAYSTLRIPNVIVDENINSFKLDLAEDFKILCINSDPAKAAADIMYK